VSRIGRKPIVVPDGVTVEIRPGSVAVRGPKGELSERVSPQMTVKQEDGQVIVARPTDRGDHRALHGLTRTLVANMVTGVTEGFTRRLEINGVGYRAMKAGDMVMFQLGFSHPVGFEAPEGVTLTVEGNNRVVVTGADKELVGETAARIRRIRPPEPYKGKGIKYAEETIRRKAGKAGAKGKK
jgi:large subunit ribosomal protein L6